MLSYKADLRFVNLTITKEQDQVINFISFKTLVKALFEQANPQFYLKCFYNFKVLIFQFLV